MPPIKAPCKNCERRYVGCQSKCDDYKAFVEDMRARRAYVSAKEADIYTIRSKRRRNKID